MSTETLIELGPLSDDGADGPAGDGRISPRLFLVVSLVLAFLLGGAVRPAGPALPEVFAVPVAANPQYEIIDSVLYVLTADHLSAYQLPDGRLRWRFPAPGDRHGMSVDTTSGTVLVVFAGSDESSVTEAALDLTTGKELWRRGSLSGQINESTDALVLYEGDNVVDPSAPQPFVVIARRTGQVLWRGRLDDHRNQPQIDVSDPAAPALIQTNGEVDPELVRYDLGTGRVLARTMMSSVYPAALTSTVLPAGLVGGLLLFGTSGPDGPGMLALDARTFAVHWHTPTPVMSQYASDCGDSICLYGAGSTTLLDRATGAVLADAPWQYAYPIGGGRMLAQDQDRQLLVDSRLRQRYDLGEWTVVALDPIVVTRPGKDLGQAWVGLLDPAGDRVLPLAQLRKTAIDSCFGRGAYLACRRQNDLVVFRI